MRKINDCVKFKNELHKKLYIKSGAKNFDEYIKYINANYSDNKNANKNVIIHRSETSNKER